MSWSDLLAHIGADLIRWMAVIFLIGCGIGFALTQIVNYASGEQVAICKLEAE